MTIDHRRTAAALIWFTAIIGCVLFMALGSRQWNGLFLAATFFGAALLASVILLREQAENSHLDLTSGAILDVAALTSLTSLTSRERDLLSRIAAGRTNEQIAAEMFISNSTVKTHINNIYRKLAVGNRAQAVRLFLLASSISSGELTR